MRPPACTADARRYARLARETVDRLKIDLDGLVVATEAATGPYAATAAMAALAGADEVVVLGATSRHGTAADAIGQTLQVASEAGADADRIRAFDDRAAFPVEEAHVITNLGPLRPLDASFLGRCGPGAAVAYMCEAWEYRAEDVDLGAARKLGIPVLGTRETGPELRIFDYLGPVAMRLLLELEIDLIASRIVVFGGGVFGSSIARLLRRVGADVTRVDGASRSLRDASNALAGADALVVAEYPGRTPIIGPAADLSAAELAALNPTLRIAHVAGAVDREGLEEHGLASLPERFAPAGWMSVATDYAGPRPVLLLHGAGLVVGAALARARRSGLRGREAEEAVAAALELADLLPQ